MVCALFVPSSLLMRSEELEIPVKSLSDKSLSHPFNHQSGSVFLALFEMAYASPAPHSYRKSSVKQLPECFINCPSLACPDSLCLYPQLFLSFQYFVLKLLISLLHCVV